MTEKITETSAETSSKAICILGMHRSGTSAITRAVNLLGAYLGEEADMMRPQPDNPAGYWERNDLYRIHDRILDLFKKKWDTVAPLPKAWHRTVEMKPIREELAELIKENFSGHGLWAWKDPRTTVLFDLWKDVLDELGIDLACLYVVRNPLDVARSLERRDGFPLHKSFGIWFNDNITALEATASVRRVFISYDRFLLDWEAELKRCAEALGVPWPGDDSELREQMKGFLRPDLRHSLSGVKELEDAHAPEPVVKLYRLIDGAIYRPATDASFGEKVEELSREFSSYASFFRHDMAELWERGQRIADLDTRLGQKDERIKALGETVKQKDGRIEALGEIVKQKDERIEALGGELKKRDASVAGLRNVCAKKDKQLAAKDQRIEALLGSWSWKVTGPMRYVLGSIKK